MEGMYMADLGKIERKGGKRYGYWEVNDVNKEK